MRGVSTLVSACVIVLGGPAACRNGERPADVAASAAASSWAPARTAELYFSTEVAGYIEPCGCTTKPLGGVQRLATVIRRGHEDRVLVDAGNLLLPPGGLDELTREQHLLKSRMLARVYRRLGVAAINLGHADLGAGVEHIINLQREGAVPFVSANLRPVGTPSPIVARSFMRTIGGIKIGLTGVTTPEQLAGARGITAIEHAPILRAEVSALRKDGAEVIVALAHVGELGARELAEAVPELDVIVRAPGTPIEREPSPPEQAGGVIIVEAGSQGQHIGRMTLSFGTSPPERPLVLDARDSRIKHEQRRIERKLRAYRTEVESWRVDPGKAEAVRVKEEQLRRLEAELAQVGSSAGATSPREPHVRVELIALTEDVAPDPEMSSLLSAYYAQLQEMNATKGDVERCRSRDPAKAVFVGSAKCAECHEEAFAFWRKTKHAKAWATLEEQGKHFDLTCVGCHTVGFQQPGGFCRLTDVGALKDVGCESCHGPGSVHADDSEPTSIVLEAPAETCTGGCHVPDHSDAFVYEKYVREITGPGHALR